MRKDEPNICRPPGEIGKKGWCLIESLGLDKHNEGDKLYCNAMMVSGRFSYSSVLIDTLYHGSRRHDSEDEAVNDD
jgi:hypothetical protein